MTNAQGKTIQIFLPTGEPRGIRIAELTTRIVQAVLVPRSDLAHAKKRPELDNVAVYFLFGEDEEQAKPIVYIGQTEDLRRRLDSHNANKDFWLTAILGISRTESFTQAHIKYLEWYCYQQVKKVGRYILNNDVTPGKPHVTEAMEADLLDAFDAISILLSSLGYPVFEPIAQSDSDDQFYCSGPDAKATGELVEDGFVVRVGSVARIHIAPAAQKGLSPKRSKLIEGGILTEADEKLKFTQDHLFGSPTAAAEMVLGTPINGWDAWKDENGNTLHEIKRTGNES